MIINCDFYLYLITNCVHKLTVFNMQTFSLRAPQQPRNPRRKQTKPMETINDGRMMASELLPTYSMALMRRYIPNPVNKAPPI